MYSMHRVVYMIVVTVSLWPGGDERLARVLGHADIFNDGSQVDDAGGLGEVGDYEYRLVERKSTVSRSKLRKRTGRVIGFPRKELGVWDLLHRVLNDALGERSR